MGRREDKAAARCGSREFLDHAGISLSDSVPYWPVRDDFRHYGIHDGAYFMAGDTDKIPLARDCADNTFPFYIVVLLLHD